MIERERLDHFIVETTLSRVYRHFKSKKYPVALISAYRTENTAAENLKLHRKLVADVRGAGYGYVIVDGMWIDDKTKEKSNEDSILVIGGEKMRRLRRPGASVVAAVQRILAPARNELMGITQCGGQPDKQTSEGDPGHQGAE